MQLISRSKLLKLISKPDSLKEVEGAFSYRDFVDMTHKMLDASKEDWPEEDVFMQLESGWMK